jgi:hypothetical protein
MRDNVQQRAADARTARFIAWRPRLYCRSRRPSSADRRPAGFALSAPWRASANAALEDACAIPAAGILTVSTRIRGLRRAAWATPGSGLVSFSLRRICRAMRRDLPPAGPTCQAGCAFCSSDRE